MSESECIDVPPLMFLSKNPKEAFKQIKESRKSPLDKTVEKMESSSYYDFFIEDVELKD